MADPRKPKKEPPAGTEEEAGIHGSYEATSEQEARTGTSGPSRSEEDRTDVEVEPASRPRK
jgi:hypothetical protein